MHRHLPSQGQQTPEMSLAAAPVEHRQPLSRATAPNASI
jgi:hypothetical protein